MDSFTKWIIENGKRMDKKDRTYIIKLFEVMDKEKAYEHHKFFETLIFTKFIRLKNSFCISDLSFYYFTI